MVRAPADRRRHRRATVGKALDQFGIDAKLFARWTGRTEARHARGRRGGDPVDARAEPGPARTFAAGDFPAFYCGGSRRARTVDPYRAAPLEACERARTAAPGTVPLPDGIAPALVPGYVLAIVVPLSVLPFSVAVVIWYALLIAAVAATVELLRALTGLPRAALVAAVFGTGVVSSVTYGQLAPLATLGITAAALALRRGRSRLAAAACAARAAAAAGGARTGRVAAAVAAARARRDAGCAPCRR